MARYYTIDEVNGIISRLTDMMIEHTAKKIKEAGSFSLDDIQTEYDGERRLSLKFVMGSKVKAVELVLPIPIYRGTHDPDTGYEIGDSVTSGGSLWICQTKNHGQKPGTTPAWRLSAKRGSDGGRG